MKRIPDPALEQHIAVLGKSGSGKTYAAKAAIVEPMLQHGKRVGIVDPTGAWWGLRSHADGKRAGFPVLVLGGDHGDLPLVPNGGEAVARLLVEQGVSLVADTGRFTVGERTRWMVDFAGAVYRLNRSPLYLVLDEAHVFAPQGKVPDPDTGKMLHAVNQIASGGRSRGIRLTMITQRPQKLHKDTLTTADTLIAMRVMHPLDRNAVREWIDGCGDPAQGKQVLDSLAGLQRGEGWVWYPEGAHLARGKFPPIGTFDSSATPTGDSALAAPKTVAEIDLTEIKKSMAEAVAQAEANDPKLLRARLAKLEAERAEERKNPLMLNASEEQIAQAQARGYARGVDAALGAAREWVAGIKSIVGLQQSALSAALAVPVSGPPMTATEAAGRQAPPAPRPQQTPQRALSGQPGVVDKPMPRAFLTALAQHRDGLTKGQILVHTTYRSSGPVSGCFAELLRNGWVIAMGQKLAITEAGVKALGEYQPLPVGADLRAHLLNGSKCSTMEKAMLKALFDAYPGPMPKGEVLRVTGYASSGPVSGAFARLVALGYAVPAGRSTLRAAEDLFRG